MWEAMATNARYVLTYGKWLSLIKEEVCSLLVEEIFHDQSIGRLRNAAEQLDEGLEGGGEREEGGGEGGREEGGRERERGEREGGGRERP